MVWLSFPSKRRTCKPARLLLSVFNRQISSWQCSTSKILLLHHGCDRIPFSSTAEEHRKHAFSIARSSPGIHRQDAFSYREGPRRGNIAALEPDSIGTLHKKKIESSKVNGNLEDLLQKVDSINPACLPENSFNILFRIPRAFDRESSKAVMSKLHFDPRWKALVAASFESIELMPPRGVRVLVLMLWSLAKLKFYDPQALNTLIPMIHYRLNELNGGTCTLVLWSLYKLHKETSLSLTSKFSPMFDPSRTLTLSNFLDDILMKISSSEEGFNLQDLCNTAESLSTLKRSSKKISQKMMEGLRQNIEEAKPEDICLAFEYFSEACGAAEGSIAAEIPQQCFFNEKILAKFRLNELVRLLISLDKIFRGGELFAARPMLLHFINLRLRDCSSKSCSLAIVNLGKEKGRYKRMIINFADNISSRAFADVSPIDVGCVLQAFVKHRIVHKDFLNFSRSYFFQEIKKFSASSISWIVWCFANLSFKDLQVFSAASQALLQHSDSPLDPQTISRLVWAYSYFSIQANGLKQYFEEAIEGNVSRFVVLNPQGLVSLMWSIAKYRLNTPVALQRIPSLLLPRLSDLQFSHLCCVLWALASMRSSVDGDASSTPKAFVTEAIRRCEGTVIPRVLPSNVSQLLWACATLGIKDSRVMDLAFRIFDTKGDALDAQCLVLSFWAYAKTSCWHLEALKTAEAIILSRLLPANTHSNHDFRMNIKNATEELIKPSTDELLEDISYPRRRANSTSQKICGNAALQVRTMPQEIPSSSETPGGRPLRNALEGSTQVIWTGDYANYSSNFRIYHISSLLWACGWLNYRSPNLLQALSDTLYQRVFPSTETLIDSKIQLSAQDRLLESSLYIHSAYHRPELSAPFFSADTNSSSPLKPASDIKNDSETDLELHTVSNQVLSNSLWGISVCEYFKHPVYSALMNMAVNMSASEYASTDTSRLPFKTKGAVSIAKTSSTTSTTISNYRTLPTGSDVMLNGSQLYFSYLSASVLAPEHLPKGFLSDKTVPQGDDLQKNQRKEQISLVIRRWQANFISASSLTRQQLQIVNDLGRILRNFCSYTSVITEFQTPEGFSLDIAILPAPEAKMYRLEQTATAAGKYQSVIGLAIELNGPSHFLTVHDTHGKVDWRKDIAHLPPSSLSKQKSGERMFNGPTQLKHKILRRLGWWVLLLNSDEIPRRSNARREYIGKLLAGLKIFREEA